jgi:Raf kinase inhibitor-like YbhB/YbcL family protein
MMRLLSPAFRDGAPIPRQHMADGAELSPPLSWSDLPHGTSSLVLLMEDADVASPAGPAKRFLLWSAYGLQPATAGLELGANRAALPSPARAGRNDLGVVGYSGAVPAKGQHRYVFRLLALDRALDPDTLGEAGRDELFAAVAGHVLETAELSGTYERGGG